MAAVVAALLLLGACADPNADSNERVTGSGGKAVRYSSRQVTVDLTAEEHSTLEKVRDHTYPNATGPQALHAVVAALEADGYAPVTSEADTGIAQGGHGETLVPKWREVLRGVVKAKFGFLPAKPDHQYTTALVSVRATEHGHGVVVRARFDNTVYDTNGDSQTKTVIKPDAYDDFFALTARALSGENLANLNATASASAATAAPHSPAALPQ
ncbi:hypothetical protein [Paraburkholderia megapolitana]|uniref:Uncharacterized protein n=1 Tax=Paraburkholderia megapolitana TaxID=420953 RepID=A0A1I3EC36_9BURK|nr:hypothetical protein [Paraburkholderia megapolitana]SFH96542.1 hypothetical protein SAMN05192543_101790 [Paraburkholderia megapolitana]